MKIRTNLFLLCAIFVMLIAALGFIVLQTFSNINTNIHGSNSSSKLIKDLFELNIITYEYVMHHEKRMQEQWVKRFNSVGKQIGAMKRGGLHLKYEAILKSITSDYKTLGILFSQIQANFVKRKRLIDENESQQYINMTIGLEQRLIAQFLMRAQKITTGAFRASIIMQQAISRVQHRTNFIVIFCVIGFAILSAFISFFTAITITRPLNELITSSKIIADGNLEHRVDIKTKNEISKLALAFNHMTEKRQLAEEGLRQSEAKYIDLYSSAPVAYFSADTEGSIKAANKAAEYLTGYPSNELHKMKVFNLYAEESKTKAKELFQRFKQGIPFENEEMIYKRKDGRKLHGALSVRPIKEESGLVHESRSVVVDITKRKQTERELEKHREHLENTVKERTADLNKRVAEMEHLNNAMVNLLEDLRVSNENLEIATQQLTAVNKELESFSYSVSHDLRAPLRAIRGFSQILVEDYKDKLDANGFRQLDVIQSSARQMGQLIDDLLSFSRLGRKGISMAEIDMTALAQDVSAQLQITASELEPQVNIEALPSAIGDRNMVRQVFVNLLSNSMKYTKSGEPALIEVTGTIDDNENIYSVKDNGVGFDMQYADKLFRVFQRLHSAEEFEGTGIGLALVQRIIHRHGGRVWAESQLNQGATFYFTLP